MDKFGPKFVLCPVDFSGQSASALRVAGAMAKSLGAEVAVLHVQRLEAPVYFTAAQTKSLREQLRRSLRAANKLTREFAHQHLPQGVPHRVIVEDNDDPVSAILKKQRELGAGLVAMGTHGRGGLARIRLGSIAESVLHHAEVPILTVGPRFRPPAKSDAPIRRVLCPVDYGPSSKTALEYAVSLATAMGAELIVAHIDEMPQRKSAQDSLKRLCEWVPASLRSRCAIKEVVKQGAAAEQIVEQAVESQSDLLVIGAQPRRFLGTELLGSTAELVIRSAPCPTVTVMVRE